MGKDLDDEGVDITALWQGLPVAVQTKHYAADEFVSIKEVGYFCSTAAIAGVTIAYLVTSGQVGTNSRARASKARPEVVVVAGGSLWRAVSSQRSGQVGLIRKPAAPNAKVARGCALALWPKR